MKRIAWLVLLFLCICAAILWQQGSAQSGLGLRHVRVATGSILTLVRTDVTCTWPTAFSDTNYTVSLAVEDTSALGLGLQPERIRSKTASTVTVQVFNASLGTLSGTLHCVAFHD